MAFVGHTLFQEEREAAEGQGAGLQGTKVQTMNKAAGIALTLALVLGLILYIIRQING